MAFHSGTSLYRFTVYVELWHNHPLLSHVLLLTLPAIRTKLELTLNSPLSETYLRVVRTNTMRLWQLFCSSHALTYKHLFYNSHNTLHQERGITFSHLSGLDFCLPEEWNSSVERR